MRKLLQGALLLCGAWMMLAAALPARAQSDFPSRPIKMYVPFPPAALDADTSAQLALYRNLVKDTPSLLSGQ